jgi:hypothetical protein
MTMRKIVAAMVATSLAGCATPNPAELKLRNDSGPEPAAAEVDARVRSYLARSLKDPDSLKQFKLLRTYRSVWSRGWARGGDAEAGWVACYEYNAKNSYGAYTGLKTEGLIFRNLNGTFEELPEARPYVYIQC